MTDGVISDKQPQYLDLYAKWGYRSSEREWMIDQGPYSRNAVTGEDAYFLFTLNNWKEKADKVQFMAAWLMTRIRLRMDMRLFARDRMMEILDGIGRLKG